MKLFFIRYSKILFSYLHLHLIFSPFNSFFGNLFYLTKFSKWINSNKKIEFNDFPCKWNYFKRYELYKWVVNKEYLQQQINYLEFGVASGASIKWFLEQNKN